MAFTDRFSNPNCSVSADLQKDSLIVIHEDGEMSSWEWTRESWKWVSSGFGSLRLPSNVYESSTPRRISQAIVVPGKRIYWTEIIIEDAEAAKSMRNNPRAQSHALLSCDYALLSDASKPGSLVLEMASTSLVAAWSQALLGIWLAPENGLWIHLSSSPSKPTLQLGFLSTITNKMVIADVEKDVHHFTHHPTTLELVLLDEKARITLLHPHNERISQILLSTLKTESIATLSSIYLHQHSILLVTSAGWELLDIRSGVLVSSYKWPSPALNPQVWSLLNDRDTSLGFWGTNGLWRLKSLSVAQYTNIVASAVNDAPSASSAMERTFGDSVKEFDESSSIDSPLSPQMAAALIAKDWSLSRLEAKYLLDVLMTFTAIEHPTMRDTAIFIAACDRLIPHLQSPIILISILEEARMSSFACDITRQFINTYMARHTSGMSVVSQNEVDLRAFQLFTAFNADTIGLLTKYVEISADNSHSTLLAGVDDEKGRVDDPLRAKLTATEASEFSKMDLNDFYLYLNRCSDMLLLKLIEFSGIGVFCLDSSSRHFLDASFPIFCEIAFLPAINLGPPKHMVNTALLREEERPTHPDLFSVMCLLLYRYEPQWILPFVDVLMREEMMQDGRSLLPRRALAAIPTFEPEAFPAPSPAPSPRSPRLPNSKRSSTDLLHQWPKEDQQRELRLLARLGLYERARRHSSSLTLLLNLYGKTHSERYWRLAMYSIDSKSSEFPGRRGPGGGSSKRSPGASPRHPERHAERNPRNGNGSSSSGSSSASPSNVPDDSAAARQATYLQKTRTELLTTLLMYCLDPQNKLAKPRYFEDIFSRLPTKLTAMDLTTSLRQEFARMQSRQSTPPVLVTDITSQMSVSTLRAQLLKLGVK